MRRFPLSLMALAALSAVSITSVARSQDEPARRGRDAGGLRVIARNLDNPSGIAIHPETEDVFIAEHRGIVRLFRQQGEEGRRARGRVMEISGYPSDIYGKGPMYNIGPLGIAFMDGEHLIVGDGSRPDAEELVRIYDIEAEAPQQPAAEDSAEYTLGPITAGDESAKGEGNFYGVAVTDSAIYVTSNGDDTKGWILRSVITDGKPGELKPFIATKALVEVDAPVAITVSPEGDLVVGQMGEVNVPGDSLLTFYDAATGALKKKLTTGLSDITGLAYSAEGKLYAVDFSWSDPAQGGLFELTVDGDAVKARKVVSLDKPTALAFTKTGRLLITVFGTAAEGSTEPAGQLILVGKGAL